MSDKIVANPAYVVDDKKKRVVEEVDSGSFWWCFSFSF